MYKRSIFILSLLLILCFTSTPTLSQSYGKIFTKAEADHKFGPVVKSINVPTSSLRGFLNQTSKYLMFKIMNEKVFVLDNKRNTLYPGGENVNSTDVFTVYSISVISELLRLGNSGNISVEQRNSVLTVSNGGFTLEVGVLCPPFCPGHDD